MKKVIAVAALLPLLVACGKGSDSKSSSAANASSAAAPSSTAASDNGGSPSAEATSQTQPTDAQGSASAALSSAIAAATSAASLDPANLEAVAAMAGVANLSDIADGNYDKDGLTVNYKLGKASRDGKSVYVVHGTAKKSGAPGLSLINFEVQDSSGGKVAGCQVPYFAAPPLESPIAQVCGDADKEASKLVVTSVESK